MEIYPRESAHYLVGPYAKLADVLLRVNTIHIHGSKQGVTNLSHTPVFELI